MVAVNEAGVAALNGMAGSVESGTGRIVSVAGQLVEAVDGLNSLGPHKISILKLAKQVVEAVSSASEPAKVVSGKLKEKAVEYRQFIENDRFGAGGI